MEKDNKTEQRTPKRRSKFADRVARNQSKLNKRLSKMESKFNKSDSRLKEAALATGKGDGEVEVPDIEKEDAESQVSSMELTARQNDSGNDLSAKVDAKKTDTLSNDLLTDSQGAKLEQTEDDATQVVNSHSEKNATQTPSKKKSEGEAEVSKTSHIMAQTAKDSQTPEDKTANKEEQPKKPPPGTITSVTKKLATETSKNANDASVGGELLQTCNSLRV